METRTRRAGRRRAPGAALWAAPLVALTASCAPGTQVMLAEDRYPHHSAADWVTYADHVVVVTAEREREGSHAPLPFIDREVDLRVDRILWSRPGAARAVPATVGWTASGWVRDDSGGRTRTAVEGAPRVEAGHSYVLALVWEEARCDEGDPRVPAAWRGLGSGGAIPFDGAVLGAGESEGRVRTAAEAREDADARASGTGLTPSLEDEVTGKGTEALTARLEAAVPGERRQFARPAPCP
ncbi:hypothetical protein ACFYOG_02400 [Streptomyces sp. NPDC007818]|uniref:hypothetical protein n=1 Tax=Streptomyces sp. NPDC007818 TaxID=3364780 RepID=UPI0036796E8B